MPRAHLPTLSFLRASKALMDTGLLSAGTAASPDPGTTFRLCVRDMTHVTNGNHGQWPRTDLHQRRWVAWNSLQAILLSGYYSSSRALCAPWLM